MDVCLPQNSLNPPLAQTDPQGTACRQWAALPTQAPLVGARIRKLCATQSASRSLLCKCMYPSTAAYQGAGEYVDTARFLQSGGAPVPPLCLLEGCSVHTPTTGVLPVPELQCPTSTCVQRVTAAAVVDPDADFKQLPLLVQQVCSVSGAGGNSAATACGAASAQISEASSATAQGGGDTSGRTVQVSPQLCAQVTDSSGSAMAAAQSRCGGDVMNTPFLKAVVAACRAAPAGCTAAGGCTVPAPVQSLCSSSPQWRSMQGGTTLRSLEDVPCPPVNTCNVLQTNAAQRTSTDVDKLASSCYAARSVRPNAFEASFQTFCDSATTKGAPPPAQCLCVTDGAGRGSAVVGAGPGKAPVTAGAVQAALSSLGLANSVLPARCMMPVCFGDADGAVAAPRLQCAGREQVCGLVQRRVNATSMTSASPHAVTLLAACPSTSFAVGDASGPGAGTGQSTGGIRSMSNNTLIAIAVLSSLGAALLGVVAALTCTSRPSRDSSDAAESVV